MPETRITLEETNDFATALRVRGLAIGMDLATLRGFLDRAYTAAQIDRWEAGTSEPSIEEKATILATLAYVQSEILAAYESYIHDISAGLSLLRRRSSSPRHKRITRLFMAIWLRNYR